MVRIFNRAACLVMLFACSGSYLQAQLTTPVISIIPRARPEFPADATPDVRLRVDASLVLVPVHAATAAGTAITDLSATNFQVFEDGVEQKVSYFSKQDAPLSVGLVFDASGSMSSKIRKSAEAAAAFFKTANAADEFFLVEFGEKPKLNMPFTTDSSEIYRRIAQLKPFGRTSLIDAIHMGLGEMKYARNSRKALVILSDGGDNRSRFTRREIKSVLLESNVQLYAMGLFNHDGRLKQTAEEKNGPDLLEELADATGGQVYIVDNVYELDAIGTRLGNVLRNEYVLGYLPSNPSRDGKYHHMSVKVLVSPGMPKAILSYRQGYYAPPE